jgi:DNA-binding GntR family transcriptional regulator
MARSPTLDKAGVTPLRRRRLVDDATQSLREAILDGRLAGGARLRQTELAERLGISRTPIREALTRLGHEGLIELLPRGGVRVLLLNADEALELYDLREALDGLAARLAAARADAAALSRLERSLARMADCVDRGDPTHWFRAHVAFHEEIVRSAGNRPLGRVASVVLLSIRQFHPLLLKTARRLEDAYREHRGIFEAIAARDGEAAERLARAHIKNAKMIVLGVMAVRAAAEGEASECGEPGERERAGAEGEASEDMAVRAAAEGEASEDMAVRAAAEGEASEDMAVRAAAEGEASEDEEQGERERAPIAGVRDAAVQA